jgi:hypothetical protein
MIPGYNHNVMHKGKLFHIQTEDLGEKNPVIVTHLFLGGNVVDTKRTSYADILGSENREELIREMMEEQHKSMLRDLKRGKYDAQLGLEEPQGPGEEEELEGKSLDEIILNYLLRSERAVGGK